MTTQQERLQLDAADLLAKTADRIDEHGWLQHIYHGKDFREVGKTPGCLIGSMRLAAGIATEDTKPGEIEDTAYDKPEFLTYRQAELEMGRCIRNEEGYGYWFASPIGFNDTPGRTKEQVTRALRACADRLRSKVKGQSPDDKEAAGS